MWASAMRANPERRTRAEARKDFIVGCKVEVVGKGSVVQGEEEW